MTTHNHSLPVLPDDLAAGRALLGFIGSSRVGKTTLCRQFAEKYNGNHIEFDELISREKGMKKLIDERVPETEGISAVERMGRAVRTPFENEHYEQDQQLFIEDETHTLNTVAKKIRKGIDSNTFLDFTGSAPYAQEALQNVINTGVIMIYLQASSEHSDEIVQGYLRKPSPIVWGSLAAEMHGKSLEQDLEHYMRKLLTIRNKMYTECCDVIIPWEEHRGRAPEYVMEHIVCQLAADTVASEEASDSHSHTAT